jgi:light-regulated signal transduction histidine kinase (bacteriophytochrome)
MAQGTRLPKYSREMFALHKDGHEFPIEVVIFRVEAEEGLRHCAFIRDITERNRSKEQLERIVQERTVKLSQSNKDLRQFAKIASHDLQEPLKTMQGFVHLLKQTNEGKLDSDSTEFIEYIYEASQRMKHLIQSILLHSQINDTSNFDQITDCNSVIEDVLAGLSSTISEADAVIHVDNLPTVAVERTQVVQIFQNLISNAIKYRGKNNPEIHISVERVVDSWIFSVQDNSIGIEPQYADSVFDMFSRLHTRRKFPGAGMGLAICKRVVTLHGGSIWVESTPGLGSVFLFTLPAIKVKGEKV